MEENNKENNNKNKRKKIFFYFAVALVITGIVVFCLWFFYFRTHKSTDDAYVHGNMIELNAQVPGTVITICAEETDFVKKDQILVELDPTNYVISLERAKASLASQVRSVANMFATCDALKAQLVEAESSYEIAKINYDNRAPLVSSGAISKEEFQHVTLQLNGVTAELERVYEMLRAQEALVGNTTIDNHPLVNEAKDRVRQAWVDLKRTKIVAPTDGYVGMRKVQLGESVSQQTPLLAVVPLNEIWINANFKETQLSKMRIGQRAKMHADIYGRSVTFTGSIVGLNPGTGNVFSILPPQNATGNWIKIIQRLPVRVSIDSDTLDQHPLMLGMSMDVTIDVSNKSGAVLSKASVSKPLYMTNVYARQEEGAELIIRDIIRENIVDDGRAKR